MMTRCKYLSRDDRCRIYLSRPKICPGVHDRRLRVRQRLDRLEVFETPEQLWEYAEALLPPRRVGRRRGRRFRSLPSAEVPGELFPGRVADVAPAAFGYYWARDAAPSLKNDQCDGRPIQPLRGGVAFKGVGGRASGCRQDDSPESLRPWGDPPCPDLFGGQLNPSWVATSE